MADAVYQALDRMVPALEDLQIRGLFSAEEVRAIVAKRRDFEFLLRRRTARKADFLRYLEYEMNLDELRRLRKEKLGQTKSTASDFAGRQLIHFIFERALRKFRGDLELWLQYLDYCQATGAHKNHSRALAQALQIFPRQAGLWIRAASFEYFTNAAPPAARVLMQRGLRLNGADSPLLWTQYFKLELLYVNKLRGRRMALGIDGSGNGEDDEDEAGQQHGVDLPRLEGEEEEEREVPQLAAEDPRSRSVQAVLAGAVPRIVYASAVKARPTDLAMRLQCLEILDTLPGNDDGHFESLAQEMLAGIEQDLGPEDAAWARALHALRTDGGEDEDDDDDEEEEEAAESGGGSKRRKGAEAKASSSSSSSRKRPRGGANVQQPGNQDAWAAGLTGPAAACLRALEAGVAATEGKSTKMWSYYLQALMELLEAPAASVAAAMGRAAAGGAELTPEMYLQWAEACESQEEEAAAKALAQGTAAHPRDPRLWEARLRLATAGDGAGVERLWEEATRALGPTAGVEGNDGQQRAVADLWLVYLRWLVKHGGASSSSPSSSSLPSPAGDATSSDSDSGSDSEDEDKSAAAAGRRRVARAFERALASTRGLGRVEACAAWAEWQGRAGLEKALGFMGGAALEPRAGEEVLPALAQLCLRVIQQQEEGREDGGRKAKGEGKALRPLFEAALGICGKHEGARELWLAYEAAERAAGEHQRANTVRWRASQAMGTVA